VLVLVVADAGVGDSPIGLSELRSQAQKNRTISALLFAKPTTPSPFEPSPA